ncbi:MAG: autotransporter domain-containing protein, partial [Opitutaceae bacterium]|nr:autotransporter domain-containing protein [Opitutaceae bacterium]
IGASGTINIGLLATGTFAIMEWTGAGVTAPTLAGFALTVGGVASSPRAAASLSLSGNTLVVTNTAINNLLMKWTGAEGAEWTRRPTGAQQNWGDGGGSAESRFLNADSVVFDGVADAANPGNRVITIDDGGVTVSDMKVTGSELYKFQGLGGITADAGALGTAAFAAAGQLEKSGGGGLVFANTGANTFLGGIKIAGGMITFDRAEQIGSGTGGIVFTDSGTLRATETVSGTVFENIIVNAGKIAGLVVDDGGALAFAGTLAASGTGATLRKTGGGTVSFYSDNSASSAAVAIDEGALTLAGATAVLGGKITVASGATLGGVGAAGAGGSVTVAGGGALDAGLDNTVSGTLTVHNLETTGGAVLRMNLFKDADTGGFQQSDRIYGTGTSAISGANIIDLASFASGTYNLGSLTALASGSTSLTLSGMTIPAGGRLSGALTSNGGVLQLVTTSDQSREIRWTGAGGTAWNLAAQNWTGGAAVNQFSYGDRVLFDGAAGARAVYIDAGEVRISDMSVSGAADYTFTGGGIHASPENTQDDGAGVYIITDASGKLTKEGGGVLSFENSGNTFSGGVEINGGAIAISKGAQLATTASTGITFTGDATLRAATDLVLDDDFVVNAAKTATIDSNGYIMTLQGSVGGAADSTLAKDGVGAVVLESDLSGFSGTLAVRAGVLRAGGDNVLTNGSQSAIVVNAGATLDLDGHDQSIVNLSGIGEIALGDARLTYTVGAGSETFAGGFSGNGSVLKDGGGKWILSGSSSNSGGFILQAGELGLASAAALGAGRLTLAGAAGALSIEAAGLIIPNNMTAGTGTLTIESSGRAAEFSGMIGGDTMVLAGSGTLALSGTNYYTNLKINTPLAIARRAESIAGTVDIADGSVLEFRGAAGGLVSASIRGDSVLFTDSALILNGQNQLKRLAVGVGSRVTLSSSNALGGPSASATVQAGGQLVAAVSGITGNNITVDGGALAFGSTHLPTSYAIGSLNLSGTLSFVNGGEVRLAGLLHTGIHTAATAAGGITGQPEYNANQDGMFMTVDVDGDSLLITAYNMALEPGKDIAVGLDALRASARAVSSHLDDSFLALLAGREPPAPQNSPWVRLVGSFAEHETDKDYLGYKTDTWAGIFGFDYISSRHSMLGGYVSSSFANIKTDNAAATDMKLATLGLYGAWRANKFYFTSNLAAGLGKADTDRLEELGNRVTGSYHIRSFGAGAELGYMMPAYTRSIVRPSIGLRYNNLCFSDYAERGAGAVILDRVRADSLQAALKVDISTPLPLPWGLPGGIDIGFGWWRELNDKPTAARATLVAHPEARLQIRGDRYDESSVNARLGLRAMLDKHTLFSLSYDFDYIPFGDHHTTTQRNTFIASIRKIW